MIRPPSRSRRDAFSSSILLVDVVAVSSRKHLPGHRSFSLTLSPSLPLQSSPLRHFSCIAGDRDRSLSLSLAASCESAGAVLSRSATIVDVPSRARNASRDGKNAAFGSVKGGDIFGKLSESAHSSPRPKFVYCACAVNQLRLACFHSRRIPSPQPSTDATTQSRDKCFTSPLPLPSFLFLFILRSLFIVAERNKSMRIPLA